MGTDLTLVLPLRAKEAITIEQFYDYWLNAHVTLPARFPGIRDIWLHKVSFGASAWPATEGVSNAPAPAEEFHGVPEATFGTFAELATFQAHSRVQMEDGINFLSEMLGYGSLGDHSATLVDSTDPSPDGTDSLVRHLVFLKARAGLSTSDFRAYVAGTLAPSLAAAARKVRYHLFEPLDVTLDHPGVTQWVPVERQYQAVIEVVVADRAALDALPWDGAAVASMCSAVHAARVERCITTKYAGGITLAGVRGVAVADIIAALHANSQLEPDVSDLFLGTPVPQTTPA